MPESSSVLSALLRFILMAVSLVDASAVACAFVCFALLRTWNKRRNRLPLPPGPRRLPLIGNVLDMPEKEEWEAARKWGEKYGGS